MTKIVEPAISVPIPKDAHAYVVGADICMYMLPDPLEDVVDGTETASEMPVCGVNTAGAERTVDAGEGLDELNL